MFKQAALSAAVLSLTGGAVAAAAVGGSATFRFDSTKEAKATGARFAATLTGDELIDHIDLVLPSGAKVNRSAVPKCTAGAEATETCPAATRVATGTSTASLAGAPTKLDIVAYNATKGVIIDFGSGGTTLLRSLSSVKGATISIDLTGATAADARAQKFSLRFLPKAGFLTTPKACPSSGKLTAQVRARVGTTAKVLKATSRC